MALMNESRDLTPHTIAVRSAIQTMDIQPNDAAKSTTWQQLRSSVSDRYAAENRRQINRFNAAR